MQRERERHETQVSYYPSQRKKHITSYNTCLVVLRKEEGGKEARNFHNGGNKGTKRALRRRSSGMFCWLAGCFLFYGKTYNFEIHKTFSLII